MIKVRQIESSQPKSKWDINLLYAALKGGLLGVAYQRYLKRYPIVRGFVIWFWTKLINTIFILFSKFRSSRIGIYAYSLKLMLETTLDRQIIFPKAYVKTPPPTIYPIERAFQKLDSEYMFPEVYISVFQNAVVSGASNFFYKDKCIISHDLFRSSHDYTSEELLGRFAINTKKSTVTRLSKIKAEGEIELGALFTDAVSSNYAHFLTEVLPRVFIFLRQYPTTSATLIIDHGLHPNLMEALEFIVSENVDILGLEVGQLLVVKSLYVVSTCGYVPFQRRVNTEHYLDHSHGIFSPDAMCGMRDLIKSKALNIAGLIKHKKIFIKRNSSYRNIVNSYEIERLLVADGFTIIETEKISFAEQVNIFYNAEIIVGATGAAFANLIFCKPEAKIIILIIDYKEMIYGYWSNMAHAVGNKVSYILGENVDFVNKFHSDFRINSQDLLDAIAEYQTDSINNSSN